MANKYDLDFSFEFNAPPGKVFRALTESESLENWWATKAKIDPRKGGEFSLCFKNGFLLKGHILNFAKDRSVSYSWIDNSVPSFRLKPVKDGTLLKLTQKGIEENGSARTAAGWTYYLTNLKSVLDHGTDLRSDKDSF
jgi:uncharacterized protein YndB with AHSA1/START domain